MAKLMQPFNPANHNPDAVGCDGQLPVGIHKVIAFSNEVKATKQNTGGFLKYTLRVVEGEYAGATGADRFNLYNNNEITVRIAHDSLAQMVQAIGHQGQFDDADVLHNRPFMIEVVPQSDPAFTEVKRRFPCAANTQTTQQGFGQQSGQAPQQQGFSQPQAQPQQQTEAAQAWGSAAPQQTQQPAQQPQNNPFGSPGAQFQQPVQQQQPQNNGFGGGAGWGNQ